MRLVHLTDPHLTTPPGPLELGGRTHRGKRFLGYASWSRNRRHKLRRQWLDELTAEVQALAPEMILITGDLAQIGTVEELVEARAWLGALGPPERICLVPGNHDTYGRESRVYMDRAWADYLPEPEAGFPYLRRSGGVAVIGLSSAVPTSPLSARGRLGTDQLARLAALLDGRADELVFLLVHHPPFPGLIGRRKALEDDTALEALLKAKPVDVVLHGHDHDNHALERHGVRVYCTAAASAEAGCFRLFEVTREAGGFRIGTELRQRTGSGFQTVSEESWQVSAPG